MIATGRHAEGVRERAVAASLESRPVLVASATDHLFILLCHAFYDDLERRIEWIADLDLLFRLVPAEEWDWRLFHRLAHEHQLDHWMRKALATTQAITGRPPPPGAFKLLGAAPTWRGLLQNREIGLRGLPASLVVRSHSARSNGRKARGFARDAIDRALKPERAVALALQGQRLTPAGTDRTGRFAFPDTIVFLEGWSFPEDGWRWTDADVCVFCVPVALGKAGRAISDADAARGSSRASRPVEGAGMGRRRGRDPGFQERPGRGSLCCERSAVAADRRRERRRSGRVVAALDGLFTRMNRLASLIFADSAVRADYIEALLASEVAARLPMLDRPLPLGGRESDLMAWTGWGAPGRLWTMDGRQGVPSEVPSAGRERPAGQRRRN